MKARLQALRALRLNLEWRGVWKWLLGAPPIRCGTCEGAGQVYKRRPELIECPRCMGEGSNPGLKLGWERIRDEPERVTQEQHAIAEGVFV